MKKLERHKLGRKIEREEQWMYSGGVTGRRKRNMRRVRELADMRQSRAEARNVTGNVRMEAAEGQQSGRLVVEAKAISKDFGTGPVVAEVSTTIMRGDRIGLVGPNGAGKTTLLKMLTGELAPDSGSIRLGTNLQIVTLDQRREALKPEERVADTLTGGRGDFIEINGQKKHVASYLADFLFQPEQARSPVKVLSGGEKARLLLARALAKPSNLLVLDEPTNDLDLETLDLLQELLADYPGTLLLVSHDRDFLDRVVTSVIASEGDGHWIEYAGGYTDMLAQRKGAAAAASGTDAVGSPTGERSRPSTKLSSTRSAGTEPAQKRKLSFKQKHALETLPGTMVALEAEIGKLAAAVADPATARDTAKLGAATARLGAAQAELSAAEEQWLELEMQRQELGG